MAIVAFSPHGVRLLLYGYAFYPHSALAMFAFCWHGVANGRRAFFEGMSQQRLFSS
jgi:hypothetical protein